MDYFSEEHINPYDTSNPDFWMKIEHLGRYIYAAKRLEKHAKANGSKPLKHLDIGCANGYGLQELTFNAQKLTPPNLMGVDYNKQILKEAEKALPEATFTHLNLDELPLTELENTPFDSLTAFEVLEHLNDPQKAVHEIATVTKSGGMVLASFPNPAYERLDETGHPENPYHHHAQTLEESTKMFEDAGFQVQKILGQPLCNILFSRERNLHQNGAITEKPFEAPELNTPTRIRDMANLLAWPQNDTLEKSYTFIFELNKK